jgi:hypothetical protein
MITGTLGFFLLLLFRAKYITTEKVHPFGWVLIFLSLFWLRHVANLFSATVSLISKGCGSRSGDEMRLAKMLHIHQWSIQIVTGIIGFTVLLIVVRLLPKKVVLTFLISGLNGGSIGFYLWLVKFGKYIMP